MLQLRDIEVIASELEACRRGETKRLIICVPPRSLKSHCASVAFPAWLLGHNPSTQIICASYGQDLSNKLAMDCRSLMSSEWYRGLFPTRLSGQRQAVAEFMTDAQGFRLATSVGGVLTGRGGEFLIIDDPLKPDEALSETQRNAANEWYRHTLYSRLNNKETGCIILIMQRLHEDDLVGHVLQQDEWKVLKFPAIAPKDETHVVKTPYGSRTVDDALARLCIPSGSRWTSSGTSAAFRESTTSPVSIFKNQPHSAGAWSNWLGLRHTKLVKSPRNST